MTEIYNNTPVRAMVGNRMRYARERLPIGKRTREAFCDELNHSSFAPKSVKSDKGEMNIERLRQWEYGKNQLQLDWIPAICDVLGCDVGYLFGEHDELKKTTSDVQTTLRISAEAAAVLLEKEETPLDRVNRLKEGGFSVSDKDQERLDEWRATAECLIYQAYYEELCNEWGEDDADAHIDEIALERRIKAERDSYIFADYAVNRDALDAIITSSAFRDFCHSIYKCLKWRTFPNNITNSFDPVDNDGADTERIRDERDRRILMAQYYAGKIADEILENAMKEEQNG